MESATFAIPTDYITTCRKLRDRSTGCEIGGKTVMCFAFRPKLVEKARTEKSSILFATDQWSAYVDFSDNTIKVHASNTNIIEKAVASL